jgi:hypothetical protein
MISTLTLLATLGTVPASDPTTWVADYDQAVEIATREKKDLLVDFTGSDWCGWCIKLHDEVFSKDEFLSAAPKDFVLVALDFPHGAEAIAKVPDPERNQELLEAYGVDGFPSILLMTSAGQVYGRTGYRAGGPTAYVEHLQQMRASGRAALDKALAIVRALEQAKPAEVHALWERAVALLEEQAAMPDIARLLATPVRRVFDFVEPSAAVDRVRALKALLKAGLADDAERDLARSSDPKNQAGLLELVVLHQANTVDSDKALEAAIQAIDDLFVLGPPKDAQVGVQLLTKCAFWFTRFKQDPVRAKEYARRAKLLGPEDAATLEYLDKVLAS